MAIRMRCRRAVTPNLRAVKKSLVLMFFGAVLLSSCVEPSGGGIDVIDVSGPLDATALDFIADSIEAGAEVGQDLSVIQVNSRAVLDKEAFDRLESIIADPPLPLAVWVGPSPAYAFGAAADLAHKVDHSAIAPPDSLEGHYEPAVLGVDNGRSDELVRPEDTGLTLQPTIRQFLQDLDGAIFTTADGEVTVSTVREFEEGVTLKPVTFRKPGLGTRFLRLAVMPEAAFFFLIVGLTIGVFEFYALGPGVAAGVAAVSLFLGGWGLLTLPTRWWAVAGAIASLLLLVTAHQRGGRLPLTVAGAVLAQLSGMFLIDGGGQIDPRWWLILPSVLGALFFFLMAMPTVQKARLSTETIGRDGLIGETGSALVDFDPDGVVEVSGARWRATAHREAGLSHGDSITVTGVDGLFLEVEPALTDRET